MSSKIRLVLAGLTAAALIGGVMVADPADAGKKKKKRAKAKSSKVVQVSKGGNAKAGNGGHGGKGGKSGNVYNTGNVGGGGGGLITVPVTNADIACAVAALEGDNPGNRGNVISELRPQCFDNAAVIPEDFIDCVIDAGVLTEASIVACFGPSPTIQIPAPAAGGSVFSGNGGDGGGGGNGGTADGGDAGDNSNSSTVTVNRDDHSINAG